VPSWIEEVDYESELVLVIGQQADGINEAEALNYVAGYTVANDVSARKIQFAERAAGGGSMAGKNPRTFGPMGPCLVTLDEIADPMCLRIWSTVNGALRQDALTTDMIHDVKKLVAWYSQIGLDRGDMIMCGTPAGVALAGENPFLRPGDVVACGVDGVGVLENIVTTA
jgi:2-keto-4-pentenoate hydratase/2-oxohepta-3-ene-1,7-dioic acid hydratase in catechol pathway